MLQSGKAYEEVFYQWDDLEPCPLFGWLGKTARVLVCCTTRKVSYSFFMNISKYIYLLLDFWCTSCSEDLMFLFYAFASQGGPSVLVFCAVVS